MGRPTPDRFIPPPPPPWYEPPAPTPSSWHPPPPPSPSDEHPLEGLMALLFVGFFILSPLIIYGCSFLGELHENRDRAEAAAAPLPPRAPQPSRHFEELRRLRQARAANPAARRLPAFQYNPSVKHNVAGGEEEEVATCSVCLGAFQLGEMLRLLPLCLHHYHVECIDAWLDAHSTCPICRSNTVPTIDVAGLPPV